jgi:hypothetical protein
MSDDDAVPVRWLTGLSDHHALGVFMLGQDGTVDEDGTVRDMEGEVIGAVTHWAGSPIAEPIEPVVKYGERRWIRRG